MKFTKKYCGSDLKSLLRLYVRDLYNTEWRPLTYEDTSTGAKAIAL